MGNTKIQSYHIFLFPFKWDYSTNNNHISFIEKTSINNFLNVIEVEKEYDNSQKKAKENVWQHDPFNLDRTDKYNEFNYFYDYVREILYDFDKDLQKSNHEQSQVHLEYRLPKNSKYHISVLKKEKNQKGDKVNQKGYPKIYSLDIESILLNIYNSGVGIISFHLKNESYDSEQAVLDINQYGRRLYPPFLGTEDGEQPIQITQEKELANYISINSMKSPGDDFRQYDSNAYYKNGPFRLPAFISSLFEDKRIYSEDDIGRKESVTHISISPVLDDRMFVISWYKNKEKINALTVPENNFFKSTSLKYLEATAEANDFWYKFLFVDANYANCGDETMFKSLLSDHTYKRWLVPDWGSVYGISRYSFMSLMSADSIYRTHVTGMYYKMVELCLLQRASVLRFSDEITHVSRLEKEGKPNKEIMQEIKTIYSSYIHFVNKVYFREITAQEQGIELYDMLQDKMRINRHVKELESEIGELHQYAILLEEEERTKQDEIRNKQGHTLNKIAFIFLPATVVAGIFGFSTIDNSFRFTKGTIDPNFWWPLILAVLASLLGWWYFNSKIKNHD